MIINVRGTSGSGKTYAIRQLMAKLGATDLPWRHDVWDANGKLVAHMTHIDMQPIYVIGNYSANVCGGCDTISSQNMVCSLVRHFSQFGHVVFEGLILSHLYARYVALDDELTGYGDTYVWAFLDTPLELCLDRVKQRRLARGDERPFNPDNTISKYESILKCKDRVTAEGRQVVMLAHDWNLAEQLLDIFGSDRDYMFQNSYREESFR